MGVCRCKMCGANINFDGTTSTVTCPYCDSVQTVFQPDTEKKTNLYNRANTLRLNNEFDKAMSAYESIIKDFPNEAEAHFGLVLSKYGIEYVDDPKTKKKVPTCHRTLYKSIFDDYDYKQALENADVIARRLYEEEATVIDELQKKILRLSQAVEPYQIFICYKETDPITGKRTQDSVIAAQLYDRLTQKGFKVFFSRVSLENKLGAEYEPVIYSALRSAQIMLAIGTKKEFFDAPWVKNEWSRFISFMGESQGKYLIPCYKDMEAYDMPEEFLPFQGKNLNDIGFLEDLTHVITKLIGYSQENIKESTNEVVKEKEEVKSSLNDEGKMKRAFMFIEDGDYFKANQITEEVLNTNPENANAYLAKLIMDLDLKNINDLTKITEDFSSNKNFLKALKFADSSLKNFLESCVSGVKDNYKRHVYKTGIRLYNEGRFDQAKANFEAVPEFSDSVIYIEKCNDGIKDAFYQDGLRKMNMGYYDDAIVQFQKILSHKDSQAKIEECKTLIMEANYNKAKDYLNRDMIKSGIKLLMLYPDYKDSRNLIDEYSNMKRVKEINIKYNDYVTRCKKESHMSIADRHNFTLAINEFELFAHDQTNNDLVPGLSQKFDSIKPSLEADFQKSLDAKNKRYNVLTCIPSTILLFAASIAALILLFVAQNASITEATFEGIITTKISDLGYSSEISGIVFRSIVVFFLAGSNLILVFVLKSKNKLANIIQVIYSGLVIVFGVLNIAAAVKIGMALKGATFSVFSISATSVFMMIVSLISFIISMVFAFKKRNN